MPRKLKLVTLTTKSGIKVTMNEAELQVRLNEVLAHNQKRYKHGERDHLGGIPREMNDPESPFPKEFGHRACERWKPSGAKSGECITLTGPVVSKEKKEFHFKGSMRKW